MPAASELWPPALAVAAWWLVAAAVSAVADVADPAADLRLVANLAIAVPVLVAAVYGIGLLLGGRVLGIWFAAVLVALPPAGLLYALSSYRDTYLDRILSAALGLTDDSLFAAGAASAASAALVLWSVGGRRLVPAGAAGVAAGLAALLEPAASLLLLGAALCFAVARRPLEGGVFVAAVAPFLAAVLIRDGFALDVSWAAWEGNMAGLREHLWSNRVLQWLPLAGVVGLARRSLPAAALLGGWFAGFAVALGASPNLPAADGSFLVAFVPVLPAVAVFVAALPLLVPRLPARLDDRLAAVRRP